MQLRLVPKPAPARISLAGSTIFIMVATLVSAMMGFGRDVINAKFYGTSWELDTYLAATMIPTILFGVFYGALASALVPTFTEQLVLGSKEAFGRLTGTVFNAILLALSVLAVLGYVLAPYYVPVVAHGFPGPQMGVAIRMTRWLMPSIVATSLAGVATAALNSDRRFISSSLQGIALNIAVIVCVIQLNPRLGIYALVLGTTLGAFAQLAIQVPALVRHGLYRFTFDLHHPGLRRIALTLGPIVIGSAVGQASLFFDRYFATTLPPGSMAGINYIQKLTNFPQQVFAAAIATVIFPLIASQFATANRVAIRRTVLFGMRIVLFISVPAMCGLVVLARPIIVTLFERGAFGATATHLVTALMPYGAVMVVAAASNVVLTRCCFACNQTRWTVFVSLAAVTLNVLLSILFLPGLQARGLLLANGLSQVAQMLLLWMLLWRYVSGFDWKTLAISALRISVASGAMIASLRWIESLGVSAVSFAARSWYLSGELLIGAAVFLGVAKLVGSEELDYVVRSIVAKFESGTVSPPEGETGA